MVTLETVFLRHFPLSGPHCSAGRDREQSLVQWSVSSAESDDLLNCEGGSRLGCSRPVRGQEALFEGNHVVSLGRVPQGASNAPIPSSNRAAGQTGDRMARASRNPNGLWPLTAPLIAPAAHRDMISHVCLDVKHREPVLEPRAGGALITEKSSGFMHAELRVKEWAPEAAHRVSSGHERQQEEDKRTNKKQKQERRMKRLPTAKGAFGPTRATQDLSL